jgi:nucleoside-diphosphate-sugar epimerase
MNNKQQPLIFDFFSILFTSVIFLNFLNIDTLFKITILNTSFILIFLLINFYKKSSILKIFKKLRIILLVTVVLSIIKFLFFGAQTYLEIVIFPDVLLLFLFLLPRVLLNMKEFKINFIKDYQASKKGTLVIGGLGYIGSGVVLDLLKNGEKVSVLDCCMYGDDVLKKFNKFSNFNFIKGYASDVIKLGKLLRENSKVVHLAGLVGDPACALSEGDTRYFNIKTTNIIKELCFEYEIQRLIFASSCSVYGKTDELCYENSSTNPVSLYAKTKLDSEKELLESKIDTKILRFSTIFGPAERLRFDLVVNLFIAQAYYDKKITVFGGDQIRPFLHVQDASNSIKNFINYKMTGTQEIYNVGCDKLNYTINEIAKLIEKNVKGSTIVLSSENVDARNYAVSFKKYNNIFKNENFTTVHESIDQFNRIFEGNKIDYKKNIYSNLLTTKAFIHNNKIELKNINNFTYE